MSLTLQTCSGTQPRLLFSFLITSGVHKSLSPPLSALRSFLWEVGVTQGSWWPGTPECRGQKLLSEVMAGSQGEMQVSEGFHTQSQPETEGADEQKRGVFCHLQCASETHLNAGGTSRPKGGGADCPMARYSLWASCEPHAFNYRLRFATMLIHYECLRSDDYAWTCERDQTPLWAEFQPQRRKCLWDPLCSWLRCKFSLQSHEWFYEWTVAAGSFHTQLKHLIIPS